jgi:hypothetical protein
VYRLLEYKKLHYVCTVTLNMSYTLKWGLFRYNISNCHILCFVDGASRYMRVMKPTFRTIYLQFIQSLYLYMFGFASCPSSGGNNVYMQQLVRVVHFS